MKQERWTSLYPWILAALGLIFYPLFLGSVHLFDWDEINFAESSREMIVTGNYFRVMIDYQPFWEKPPFFFWLQVLSMKIFGINEFAARFPNAVFGVLTLLTVYRIGKLLRGPLFGFTWGMVYLGAFLPFLYFKSGIIDPVFNYFIFLAVYFLIRSVYAPEAAAKTRFALFSGLANGMAVLTKGPVGLLLLLLTFFCVWASLRFRKIFRLKDPFIFLAGLLAASCLWYLPELISHGFWFFREFIRYQAELFTQPVAGHRQPFYYHFLVVFIGCFPMSVWALPALFRSHSGEEKIPFRRWMLALFWVVLILFSIVKTKIVHYSSMSYLPLSYLAATVIFHAVENRRNLKKGIIAVFIVMATVFSSLIILLPFFFYHKEKFFRYIRDPFAVDSLSLPVSWTGWEFMFGFVFLAGAGVAVHGFYRKKTLRSVVVFSITSVVTLTAYLKMVVPRIEKYTQGPAIEFYESLQGQDVYVNVSGFKSYAYLFYFRQPLYPDHTQKTNKDWLIDGPTDKPVYFVSKTTEKYLKGFAEVKEIGRKGGFIFYRREPVTGP